MSDLKSVSAGVQVPSAAPPDFVVPIPQVFEESTICANPDVFLCSDWNDGLYTGWSTSANLDSKGGIHGDIRDGVGINGTKGWAHEMYPGLAETCFYDSPVIAGYTGPLYTRYYIRFSPNYRHLMGCGLQKQFYHRWINSSNGALARTMLGTTKARDIPRFSNEPDSVGIIAFDWLGHLVEYPDEPGVIALQRDTWYGVEFMTDYNQSAGTVTVKIWVDGVLQIQRTVTAAYASWEPGAWQNVKITSWMGGVDSCNNAPEQQQVFEDNVVISRSPIGQMIIV